MTDFTRLIKFLLLVSCFLASSSWAQLSLTPIHYQQLNLLQTNFASEEATKVAQAEKQALDIIKATQGTPEQQAFVRTFAARLLAQEYLQTNRLNAAVKLLEERFTADAALLEVQQQQDLNWQLIHLLTQKGDYRTALKQLEIWWKEESQPNADAFYLRAALLAQLERWRAAKPFILQALAKKKPENWLSLGVAIMQKVEDWRQAAQLQQLRLNLQPTNSSHWLALAQLQLLARQNSSALITLKLAHQQGYLPTRQIQDLGVRLLSNKQSLVAAELFEQLLASQPNNLALNKLATQAWLNTKHQTKATFALERLAKTEVSSKNFSTLGQWYFSLGQWQQAADSFSRAIQLTEQQLAKASAKQEAAVTRQLNQLQLNLAQSYIELHQTDKASEQLQLLADTPLAAQAKQWESYLQAIN